MHRFSINIVHSPQAAGLSVGCQPHQHQQHLDRLQSLFLSPRPGGLVAWEGQVFLRCHFYELQGKGFSKKNTLANSSLHVFKDVWTNLALLLAACLRPHPRPRPRPPSVKSTCTHDHILITSTFREDILTSVRVFEHIPKMVSYNLQKEDSWIRKYFPYWVEKIRMKNR